MRSAFPGRLVLAKKTPRDKDWPMIRRLVEAHYFFNRDHSTRTQIRFWMQELRTPELLVELCRLHSALAGQLSAERSLLLPASACDLAAVTAELKAEEDAERERDRIYWAPFSCDATKADL